MKPLPEENIARTLHFATGLPVSVYREGALSLAFPTPPPCAAALLQGRDALSSVQVASGQAFTPQYVQSRYGERFIYLALDGRRALLVGAFLAQAMPAYRITDIIRAQHLPVAMQGTLSAYYAGLCVVPETRHFYLGRLMETLFRAPPHTQAPPAAPAGGDIARRLMENTYEKRLSLFSHPPHFLEQELVRHITQGNRENALRILSEINALSRATLARDPLRSLKNSLICSCTLFTRAAIAGGASADDAFTLSDSYIQTLEALDSLRALEEIEGQMVLRFIDLVEKCRLPHTSPITRAAIRFIDNHLAQRITLDTIAEAVYVHPSHLSRRFKQDTGLSISTFIQKRRVEESRHFILHTQSPISEIASFYQFCSQSHFTQVFKAHTGMTPGEFRQSGA